MGVRGRSSSLFFSKMPRPPQCKFANTYNIISSSACRSNEKKKQRPSLWMIAVIIDGWYRYTIRFSNTNPEKILQVKMLNYMKQED